MPTGVIGSSINGKLVDLRKGQKKSGDATDLSKDLDYGILT